MRVSHVLLDVDGTLVDYGTAAQVAFLAAAERASALVGSEVRASELFRARTGLTEEPGWRDRPVANLRYESFRRVLATHGVTATAAVFTVMQAYEIARDEALVVFPDVRAALGVLEALGLTLIAASNGNVDLDRVGLGRHFSARHYAADIGASKPDPLFFSLALERFGLDPAATLVVGDRIDNDYVPARAAGMHAVLVDRGGLVDGADMVRVRALTELPMLIEPV
jgi:putative hydrolase of the HAD superfamily